MINDSNQTKYDKLKKIAGLIAATAATEAAISPTTVSAGCNGACTGCTGCGGSCLGSASQCTDNTCSTCEGACSHLCTNGCNDACRRSCDAKCAWGCDAACAKNCEGKCKANCADDCTGGCKTTCVAKCANDCTGGCKTTCVANCANDCNGTCRANCADDCTGACHKTCQANCANDCTGNCKANCADDCTGDCKTSCLDTCRSGCLGCTGTCGASAAGKTTYNILRGAGGVGIKLDVVANGSTKTIMSLKGGTGAAVNDGGHGQCTVFNDGAYEQYKGILGAAEGSSTDEIFKGEIKNGDKTVLKFMKDMDAPANDGVNKVTVEMLPALRFDYNLGDAPVMEDDMVFYTSELTVPTCKVKNGSKSFKEWNSTWNGKGTGFAPGSKIKAATAVQGAKSQGQQGGIFTLYAIWSNSPTNLNANY